MSLRARELYSKIHHRLKLINDPQHLFARSSSTSIETFLANDAINTSIIGVYTPVTKKLWQQRERWDSESIAKASPQETFLNKQVKASSVIYPFSTDKLLKEHYKNPWDGVRLGRILEDMDSLAGYVAYDHCHVDDLTTLPPLLVTATVEKIQFSEVPLKLSEDMVLSGRVIWTGNSSMDIEIKLQQDTNAAITALFTFVARNLRNGKSQRINSVEPSTVEDKIMFQYRQDVYKKRKAARDAQKDTGQKWTQQQIAWAHALLQQSRLKSDLPALADPSTFFTTDTTLENTFTTQPQQRNMHSNIFGGFLMRRAFEIAHSTAYVLYGSRPLSVMVDEITFKKPVAIGDLLRFKSMVLHCWTPQDVARTMVHVQVVASVIKPEKKDRYETNTFNFIFAVEGEVSMKKILPVSEKEALDMCEYYGPESS